MSNELIQRFISYAAAFEQAYETDDWNGLATYFADDARYEIGLPILGAERCVGRSEILAWFPLVLNAFDRRFGSRELSPIDGPSATGNRVWLRGTATYRTDGLPDFVLELEETVTFDGDKIVHLEDRYTARMREATADYLAAHGHQLGITLALDPA